TVAHGWRTRRRTANAPPKGFYPHRAACRDRHNRHPRRDALSGVRPGAGKGTPGELFLERQADRPGMPDVCPGLRRMECAGAAPEPGWQLCELPGEPAAVYEEQGAFRLPQRSRAEY